MTELSWLATAAAGLACSWIVSPPNSTAGRAAWTALVIAFFATVCLMTLTHRAALVIALPLAAAATPLAVIRRHRAGSQTQEIPAARSRVVIAIIGAFLLALGVNVSALSERSPWGAAAALTGAALVAGILPFHRPSTECLRAAPADIRAPALLMLGPGLWISLARWLPAQSAGSIGATLPILTLWVGALLMLARGDLPRICSATFLFAAGQVAFAAVSGAKSAMAVAGSLTAPLMLVVLLISKLERNSGTREVSELGGLARRLPRLSLALTAAAFWLVGSAALPGCRTLLDIAISGREEISIGRLVGDAWPVYVPFVMAVWGWLLLLRDLLVGLPRSPLFPEPLRDRVATPQADRPLDDLTTIELAAVIGFSVTAMVI
ncbi:hypothetical protein Pan44_25240 [Caulifigura coniformis]|uniref:Uncharacterized protein n=1 Tax=Caulifigura coniformis TaxID=2527983 RepID=A0A517SEE5_9PLAN|nr:hypothetical protein [Caulifigura coniformis]QDT54491.1 hypothetical protein Pan44_25240 [Caulifigura coniformis]